MMTWNSYFFVSPNSLMVENFIILNDYLTLILSSILLIILFNFVNLIISNHLIYNVYINHSLENFWTLVPFVILMFLAIPSLKILYNLDSCIFCGLNLAVTGHQWYWTYNYLDLNLGSIDSYMLVKESTNLRLLDVDNRLLLPSKFPLRFLITSQDVIHSWSMPSLAIKMDAVPGRLNQCCFTAKKSGVFFGQCSEICGSNHSFMPIVLEFLSAQKFFKTL